MLLLLVPRVLLFHVPLVLHSCALAAITLPITKESSHHHHTTRKGLFRQNLAGPLVASIDKSYYQISMSVGTPPQPVVLDLDTGSSDTWLLDYTSDSCVYSNGEACLTPCTSPLSFSLVHFHAPILYMKIELILTSGDHTKSSTYKLLMKDGFEIEYVDSSTSSGDYFTDSKSFYPLARCSRGVNDSEASQALLKNCVLKLINLST